METGTVKWFNSAKGFGFITPDEGTRDLFVHYSNIESTGYKNLQQGQRVHYEYCNGPKGPHAGKVGLAEGETSGAESTTCEATEETTA